MTHALLAAKTGWGKSWFAQLYIEANLDSVDYVVVLDFCDEFVGLAKAGFASWMGVGDQEASIGVDGWRAALEDNEKLILARKGLREEEWREVAADVVEAARSLDGTVLIAMDEVHFLAPQKGGYPDVIKGIATTGRGEGVSSLWITQRLATLDETPIAQMDKFILGGFRSEADISKVANHVEYNVDIHDITETHVAHLDEELRQDGEGRPVRRYKNDEDQTVGSEWVRSDDTGAVEWVDTRHKSMESTHYGTEGHTIEDP